MNAAMSEQRCRACDAPVPQTSHPRYTCCNGTDCGCYGATIPDSFCSLTCYENWEDVDDEDKIPTHFGPIYGRPPSASMALCDSTPLKSGESKTLSRALRNVDCPACLEKIERLVDATPITALEAT